MSETKIYERLTKELDVLLREGEHLARISDKTVIRFSSSGLSIPYSVKKQWIGRGVSYLNANFPKAIIKADFPQVFAMNERASLSSTIIVTEDNDDVALVLAALNKCRAFLNWLPSFDDSSLSPEDKKQFWFSSLNELLIFTQQEVLGLLRGKEDGRTLRTAMLHLYGRFFCFLKSIVSLDRQADCYLLIGALRILLELYVDIFLIKNECIENGIEKFFHHHALYKYRTAVDLKRIDEQLGKTLSETSALYESLKDEDGKKALIRQIWDADRVPNHWSNKQLKQRAEAARCLDMFRDVYYYGNMFIHSGYVDFPKGENDAIALCTHVYCLSSEMFCELTKIQCSECDIDSKNDVAKEIDQISALSAIFQIWKSKQADLK